MKRSSSDGAKDTSNFIFQYFNTRIGGRPNRAVLWQPSSFFWRWSSDAEILSHFHFPCSTDALHHGRHSISQSVFFRTQSVFFILQFASNFEVKLGKSLFYQINTEVAVKSNRRNGTIRTLSDRFGLPCRSLSLRIALLAVNCGPEWASPLKIAHWRFSVRVSARKVPPRIAGGSHRFEFAFSSKPGLLDKNVYFALA